MDGQDRTDTILLFLHLPAASLLLLFNLEEKMSPDERVLVG
jgi:hypothetical protein